MVLADLRHDFVRAHRSAWDEFDAAAARTVVDEMVARGMESLEREGVDEERRRAVGAADMRYVGQHHEVTVEFPVDDLGGDAGAERIEERFHRRHEELYGFNSPGRPMEIIGLHATVFGARAPVALTAAASSNGRTPEKGTRRIHLPVSGAVEEVPVYDGEALSPGRRVAGPCIVEEVTTTILVPEDWELDADASGSFVLRSGEGT
jgi:N-methylhydantoinase A